MRRFLTLVCLLGLALPAGISISGCIRNPQGNYCNGLGYGPKDTDIASITLQPQIAGISLAYGQTLQIQSPSAFTCKGNPASVGSNSYNYGTTNNQLVDISPTGQLCAGTWNRNTGGGIADYTYCNYPNPLPSTGGLPYAVAYITATADSVTSNPVAVYIHAPVTAISLVTTSLSSSSPQQCFSQNQQAALDAQACYVAPIAAVSLRNTNFAPRLPYPRRTTRAQAVCAPGVTSVPLCSASIGTLNYSVWNSNVATFNSVTNVLTAQQPGTTSITATIAQSASSAGYFSTCPAEVHQRHAGRRRHQGRRHPGRHAEPDDHCPRHARNNPINGLNLSYESTNPIDIAVRAEAPSPPLSPASRRSMPCASRPAAIRPPSMNSA